MKTHTDRRTVSRTLVFDAALAVVSALALGGVLGACGDAADEDNITLQNGPGEFVADFDTSEAFFTRSAGLVSGSSPHGDAQMWYSKNIEPVIDDAAFTAPEGTVSIKKFDKDKDGTLDGLAVMIKKAAGYDSENGDWYYEMRDLDGTLRTQPAPGKITNCINCHAGAAATTDYLLGTQIK